MNAVAGLALAKGKGRASRSWPRWTCPPIKLRLAVDQRVPVTVYLTGFDPRTGQRWVRVAPLGVHEDVPTLVNAVFAHLNAALAEDPAVWHFLGEAERFFVG